MNIPDTDNPRIVVIGGGFAGISLIKKLEGSPFQIVLIDRHNYHTFQPLLYQVSTAGLEPDSIAYPLRKVFRKHKQFHFVLGTVELIDPVKQCIHTSVGRLSYDHLVIATGTKTNFFGNDQVAAASMPMKTIAQALDIRSLILQNIEKADQTSDARKRAQHLNFIVAGAGPTGVELAGALAEFRKGILEKDYRFLSKEDMQVHLIEGGDRVLPPMTKRSSKMALKALEGLGVKVHLNTLVTDYDGCTVTTNTGVKLETATFIWAAGVTGSPVSGLDGSSLLERSNRYIVDHFNRVKGQKNIYALGDVAYMETEAFPHGHPQVAQPAIQQGRLLGVNLKRSVDGTGWKPFRYFDKGTMATIGRNKAVVDVKNRSFGGAFAWFIWMFIHLWYLVGFRNRVVTFFNWTYNYINYDRAARLIIRPFKRLSRS